MCGIGGFFAYGATPHQEPAKLQAMRDVMAHRGPDDCGLYESPDHRAILVHRRLSIVDLSECGRQPMCNEDGTVWITFNGEIYNHLGLREGLTQRGHRYHSATDSESIIHLYEELQAGCIPHLDGMFAFAIWDARRQQMLLVRDRLGKKPLYYTLAGGKFLFASEIKALLAHPDVKRDLDLQALNAFLTFSDVPPPLTLFRNIWKLAPGHWLSCDARGTIRTERYWSILDGPEWPSSVNQTECAHHVRHLLKNAVRKRLMSDVPIGVFLSGGVDSSANVALMSQLTSEPLRTFSVGFEGFGENENFHDLPYARQMATQFACQHEEVNLTASDCKDTLEQLVFQQDEPIADPACLPMLFLSKAAKRSGVSVVLVGEGSDEVFGGYPFFQKEMGVFAGKWRMLRALPKPVRQVLYGLSSLGLGSSGRSDVLRRAAYDEPLYWGLTIAFWDTEKQRLVPKNVRAQMGTSMAGTVQGYYDELFAARPSSDSLQQISYVELCNRLPELLLMRVDKFSMAHSLEARAPFMDHELVSYALSLPQDIKISGTKTKYILKEALRGILPDNIIDRPKQGFRVPLPAWLGGELAPWAKHQLFTSPFRQLKLFDESYIRWMWDRHQNKAWDHSFDLWCLINLSAWYKRWFG